MFLDVKLIPESYNYEKSLSSLFIFSYHSSTNAPYNQHLGTFYQSLYKICLLLHTCLPLHTLFPLLEMYSLTLPATLPGKYFICTSNSVEMVPFWLSQAVTFPACKLKAI